MNTLIISLIIVQFVIFLVIFKKFYSLIKSIKDKLSKVSNDVLNTAILERNIVRKIESAADNIVSVYNELSTLYKKDESKIASLSNKLTESINKLNRTSVEHKQLNDSLDKYIKNISIGKK